MPVVVIIEDDPAIRVALGRALSRRGHTVHAAATALGGLETVVDRTPDVVVLDLGLPDVDGVRVLGMIREVSAVPVIVATARDDEAEMVRVLDPGADDYVVKPFSAAAGRPGPGRAAPLPARGGGAAPAGRRAAVDRAPGRPPWTGSRWT